MNGGLFSSLHALDVAVSAVSAGSSSDFALVAAAAIRCVDVLHGVLVRATAPALDTPQDPTPREALDGIERTLPRIIRTAINTLGRAEVDPSSAAGLRWYADATGGGDSTLGSQIPRDTTLALDLVLGRVATLLLVPAIRAIVPCTLDKTERVLCPPSQRRRRSSTTTTSESPDGADLLSLVGAALGGAPSSPAAHIALYDRVALEAIRALLSLITAQAARRGDEQRICRVARKDALHFLCDAALLSLRRTVVATPPDGPGEVLGAALEAALGELALSLSAREGRSGLEAVEEQRVLVVLERAWSVGRRVGTIGGDVCGDDAGEEVRVDMSQSDVQGQGWDAWMTDAEGEERER